jgi:propionyl-CoA carboxylase alpha chain
MGLTSVAIFSDPDAGEPHAGEADESVHLPGSAPAETYLNIREILETARSVGADAIHPGYGFLSENAEFAREVVAAGMTWIGPPPEAIEQMGSKIAAKELMAEAGVSTLPGVNLPGLSAVGDTATSIGFPIMVKASAGGGGKGMRIVHDADHLMEAIASAQREAAAAFADDTMLLERYLRAPRHIEIQIFGDAHGTVISLFERECSIQRRHQKIIEESPSPALDEKTRSRMGQAAVTAARAVGYTGAGTVEFLYEDGDFYFLEMNTRLQVEHPVTEMITGLDLVRLQIEIADGELLPEGAVKPRRDGHAIEARLYAEDPLNGFLPVTGLFHRFRFADQPGLRVDSSIEDGSRVSVHYDPMLAKVIAHAPTRDEAAGLLARSLRSASIHGPTTNRELLVRVLEDDQFLAGDTHTQFLERHEIAHLARPFLNQAEEGVAVVAAALADQADRRSNASVLTTVPSGFRNSPSQSQSAAYRGPHGSHQVTYEISTRGTTVERLDDLDLRVCRPDLVELSLGDADYRFSIARYGSERYVDSRQGSVRLASVPRFPESVFEEETGSLHAPMPGRVLRVDVSEGDAVKEGQILLVLEAMKMEHSLRAPHDGTVAAVKCSAGEQVDADAVLVVVTEDDQASVASAPE